MSAPQLGIDPEDLGLDILPAIEKSFGISFSQHDFHEDFTYGELRALVLARLPAATAIDCTTQQAFYKVRQALQPLTGGARIRPATSLAELFPTRRQRREAAAQLSSALNLKVDLVGMSGWAALVGGLLLVASLLTFFFSYSLAWAGLGLALGGLQVASWLGKSLRHSTVRELVLWLSSHHYRQSRRHPATVNRQEIAASLAMLVTEMAGLQPAELVPHAIL